MKVEQIYTGCLAQGAYYIESEGEVAIIDPLREVSPYLEKAKKNNAKIKYIFETHFHADFVSGHVTLSKQTGAPIIFGPNAQTDFEAIIATDGQEFNLGAVTIKLLHTPGHTLESSTFLLIDDQGNEQAIFTGDTLFLGDVGRPDLAQKQGEFTEKDLAGMLYDSLHNKIMPLPNDVLVYPAHGAGSACGKNMMKETVDSLGNQKKVNYALNTELSKSDFVKEVTQGLLAPPKYFPLNVQMNKSGYPDIDEVLARGTQAIPAQDFAAVAKQHGALVLDVRSAASFAKGHIPGAIFIGLDGGFAPWVGALIVNVHQPILLVCDTDREQEAVTRLSRVGFDHTLGYLEGGFENWKSQGFEYDVVSQVTAFEFEKKQSKKSSLVFDVRKPNEYASQRLENTLSTPLDFINEYIDNYPEGESFYIHCAGGYRSMIAASILKSRGIHNLIDVIGGFKAIKETKLPLTEFVCPSTL